MALILNIDTATETASVGVACDGNTIALLKNEQQREHASFIHQAIEQVLRTSGTRLEEIQAFAVTSGPGSYTGLRVGFATAKGFCYALAKPLITVNTLEVMTTAAIDTIKELGPNLLFCPMIDARRMEIFTALYDPNLSVIIPPGPIILHENLFHDFLARNPIVFFGSGSDKFKPFVPNLNAHFRLVEYDAKHLGRLADKAFTESKFSDITYSEPAYFKDFHSIFKK